MNQDLLGIRYPPPGFQAEGPVTIGSEGENTNPSGNVTVDAYPTQGSGNAVSSGGVFERLAQKEDAIAPVQDNPTSYVWVGNKTWRLLDTIVEQIVNNLIGSGGETGGENPPEYLTELGLEGIIGQGITAPINLTPATATVYEAFTYTINKNVFQGGDVTLVSAPAGAEVSIGASDITVIWSPTHKGDHYIIFWVGNGKLLGRVASMKITVLPAETVVPVGDTVLVASSIAAGMLVNIYNDGGVPKIRPAIATEVGRRAMAFVTQNGAGGQTIVPKFMGTNPYFTGLVPGTMYFLSWTTPGQISPVGPNSGSGYLWQPVGVAISPTELELDIKNHIVRSA
ncbi:hypothetical protein [Runella sp. SP2]|uniref:hypothetical protein n=1 Tax=Runella sp. SP2 TaxID=2268026 RepID=UPI000F08ECFB|nr:hypothetical protein [Runella sp. SP2]AYQ31446.1 hypothetical protein DTQ70_04280 [Runella sp. SP2]